MGKSIADLRRAVVKDYDPLASHPSTWRATRGVEVVYYIKLDSKTVKIGTTKNLLHRLKQLCRKTDEVVAIEFGGRETERLRHAQFGYLRNGRTERFTVDDHLMAHMTKLRNLAASY